MLRDFTEQNKQKLLGLVKEVKQEEWCGFTDSLGDCWYGFEGWIGKLDVKDYVDKMERYHKKVIDKNDTTAGDIEDIFKSVNNINTQYGSCFGALLAELKSYLQQIVNLSITIDPTNGVFNSEFIGGGLKDSFDAYFEKKALLDMINSDTGLTEETLSQLTIDGATCQDALETFGDIMMDNTPNLTVGEEYEVPIGPGTVFYYKVSGKVDGEGNVNLNYIIQDQKLKLKSTGFKTDEFFGLSVENNSEGEMKINSSAEHSESSVDLNEGSLSYTYKNKIGNNEYQIEYEYNPITGEFKMEEKVTTEFDGGSITSTMGIKKSSSETPWSWQPMPAPAPITSPYECGLPEWDVDWEKLLGTVVVIAGVTWMVVKVAGAIYLAPATGFTSLGLLAVP